MPPDLAQRWKAAVALARFLGVRTPVAAQCLCGHADQCMPRVHALMRPNIKIAKDPEPNKNTSLVLRCAGMCCSVISSVRTACMTHDNSSCRRHAAGLCRKVAAKQEQRAWKVVTTMS